MSHAARFLNHAEAAKQLGISPKALRLYEERGLVTPVRTAAGWRTYGPAEMARGAEVAALRGLGLSLAQVARVLSRDKASLDLALAAHQAVLEGEARRLTDLISNVRQVRADLAQDRAPTSEELARLVRTTANIWLRSIFPGRGAVSGSNCATSAR